MKNQKKLQMIMNKELMFILIMKLDGAKEKKQNLPLNIDI